MVLLGLSQRMLWLSATALPSSLSPLTPLPFEGELLTSSGTSNHLSRCPLSSWAGRQLLINPSQLGSCTRAMHPVSVWWTPLHTQPGASSLLTLTTNESTPLLKRCTHPPCGTMVLNMMCINSHVLGLFNSWRPGGFLPYPSLPLFRPFYSHLWFHLKLLGPEDYKIPNWCHSGV